jgi:cob(I)alamin adenosyltransferase
VKIYTKTGDDGTTGLFGGERVSKTDMRVEAYGTVDEVNSALGLARATTSNESIAVWIEEVQADLFALGAELACSAGKQPLLGTPRIDQGRVERLEQLMDLIDSKLEPLKNFILPGGTPAAAALHHARTVARRAERRVLELHASRELSQSILIYLNRLSDFLFLVARYENSVSNTADIAWKPRGG